MRYVFAFLTLVLSGCAGEAVRSERTLMSTDFDSLGGWLESPSLTREQAHSGMYSIKTDANMEYSLTYRQVMARLSAEPLRKVRVTAWVNVPQVGPTANVSLQLKKSVQDPTDIYNGNINLEKEVKHARTWTKVSQVFELPAEVTPATELRLYLWRGAAQGPVYLDDLTLEVEP